MAAVEQAKATIQHVEQAHRPDPTSIDAPLAPGKPKERGDTPAEIAQTFLDSIQKAISAKDIEGIVKHFGEDGWWRDILTIDSGDMNSLRTKEIVSGCFFGRDKTWLIFILSQAGSLKKFGVPKIEQLKVTQVRSGIYLPYLLPSLTTLKSPSMRSSSPSTTKSPGSKLTPRSNRTNFAARASSDFANTRLEPGKPTPSLPPSGRSRDTRSTSRIADLSALSTARKLPTATGSSSARRRSSSRRKIRRY